MLNINGSKIILTRGDSAHISVPITRIDGDNISPYEIQPSDHLRFTAKKSYSDHLPALQIEADSRGQFKISPQDTKELEFGTYVYDIELETSEGDIYTVVPNGSLVIDREAG